MRPDRHALRQDRAIGSIEADALDRGPFVDNLVRALVDVRQDPGRGKVVRSTGFTVGLTGGWGSGKSSVMYLMGRRLGLSDRVVVSALNPWLFKGRDELVQAFFNGLRGALGRSPREEVAELLKGLERYRGAVDLAAGGAAAYADLHGAGGAAAGLWGRTKEMFRPRPRSPDEERAALEAKLKKANVAVVVLIDELDRVEDDEVRAVAQLIRAVGDIKGISYLVAYDHDRVARALGHGCDQRERLATGTAYLEKIIQFAVPLRPLFAEDVKALLDAALEHFEIALPEGGGEHRAELLDALVNVVRTPREVKRLAGAYAVLDHAVRGEIDPVDVLAYAWLSTRHPAVRQRIAEAPDRVVDDPGEEELLRRHGRDRPTPRQAVEQDLEVTADEPLSVLRLLFPRYADEGRPAAAGDRLSKRRNLIRLLYLGDPPGSISRREVERVWTSGAEGTETALRAYRDAGRLRAFIERLADVLPEMPAMAEGGFWPALSRVLVRPHDWITGPETLGDAADDVGQLLWNFGTRGEAEARRVASVMDGLAAAGDLLTVPWLLRRELYGLGMSRAAPDRGAEGPTLLGRPRLLGWLDAEEPRIREAVVGGYVLRRLPDAEAVYLLSNAGRWDDELRVRLTDQLASMEAIQTFAALTVRPGFISTREAMAELIDAEAVAERLRRLVSAGGLPEDGWLAASVRRLQATLLGRDAFHVGRGRRDEEGDVALFGPVEPGTG